MALSNLFGWKKADTETSAACGTACGASDNSVSGGNTEEKPAACGASDNSISGGNTEEKPAACGTACGAADKPAACGTACGASDK